MRILYAIQGTGNGHISRARDIIPLLEKKGELDILISGTEAEVELACPVKYRFRGMGFVFGKKGGIDLLATYKKSNIRRLYNDMKKLPVEDYDLVISDFEPVSAWACRLKKITCIGLSHQAAVINKRAPKPYRTDLLGKAILKHYAPVTLAYGFHFSEYDKEIFTPVIRSQIRNASPVKNAHYTVYLPAYEDKKIIKILAEIRDIKWEVFSKHTKNEYHEMNVHIQPINNEDFVKSLVSCTGVLCGAGFESPAEALFLRKKLMVIPMKGQYEQQCNAAALKEMGIPVIKSLKKKHLTNIIQWVASPQLISANYPDITEKIIDNIIATHTGSVKTKPGDIGGVPYSVKKLKRLSLGKILQQNAG